MAPLSSSKLLTSAFRANDLDHMAEHHHGTYSERISPAAWCLGKVKLEALANVVVEPVGLSVSPCKQTLERRILHSIAS